MKENTVNLMDSQLQLVIAMVDISAELVQHKQLQQETLVHNLSIALQEVEPRSIAQQDSIKMLIMSRFVKNARQVSIATLVL